MNQRGILWHYCYNQNKDLKRKYSKNPIVYHLQNYYIPE